jgi:hypothetical protein
MSDGRALNQDMNSNGSDGLIVGAALCRDQRRSRGVKPLLQFGTLLCGVIAALAASKGFAGTIADSPSPLVRAQAGSAIKWHAWDAETLALAAAQEKPVYVFVASELSGLSRATIAQTFASEKTIEWINENFFCIFVDEDAQPEVGAYAQHYINSVKQVRGSPVHFWLTPDMKPYDGANYLPPSEEWGRPGFLKSARSALDAFHSSPQHVKALSEEALSMMRLMPVSPDASDDATARLASATESWVAAADKVNGGFGDAPKNPEPELIRFLLGRGDAAREVAVAAARAIVKGGLRDTVDGGFYRRCIDEAWKEPYHQKLLSDQARIAIALFDAADAAKDDKLRAAALGALDFVLKELKNPDGTFAAALDGTLEENYDSVKRPKFAKVGSAKFGAQALFAVALHNSGEERYKNQACALAERLRQDLVRPAGAAHAVAGDFAAVALALRTCGDVAGATQLIAHADATFLDRNTGRYMATPAELPSGIAFRVPASSEPLSAEVLAVLAGADAATAKLLRLSLLSTIEYDELPSGDVLLALGQD